jgi:branched-chain amino acid transport system substrate-binding protein
MAKLGIMEVRYDGITEGETDLNATVSKIKSTDAQAVFFGGCNERLARCIKAVFTSDDVVVTNDLVTAAGGAKYWTGY